MVKPVFQAAAKIRKAETADEAFEVALLFLSSSDAKEIDPSESGTFLNVGKYKKRYKYNLDRTCPSVF
mgnify:CR=1 FL=1